MAHESGLFAYFGPRPISNGGLLCVGPFSAYKRKLTKQDVFKHTALAIIELESKQPYNDNCYTIWGLYSSNLDSSFQINLMDQPFGFSPNLSFRTTLLLSISAPKRSISREWAFNNVDSEIEHRSGIKFTFERNKHSKSEVLAIVERTGEAYELATLDPAILPFQLKALATTAFSVLSLSSSDSVGMYKRERSVLRITGDFV